MKPYPQYTPNGEVDPILVDLWYLKKLEAENEKLREELKQANKIIGESTNGKLCASNFQYQIENKRYKKALEDFLDYFDPKGGISDVPLGPFERAKELLKEVGE